MKRFFAVCGLVCGMLCRLLLPSPTHAASSTSENASSAANSVSGAAVVQTALRYLGYPYTTTGNSPKTGFSCIGFVSYVYQSLGIPLPDDLSDAYNFAPHVPFAGLAPGDVLFFQNTVWPGLSHTAIYIGDGQFIHAEWYNRGVVISSFKDDPIDYNYWTKKYLGANRPWNGPVEPVGPVPTPTPIDTSPSPSPTPTTEPAPTSGSAVVSFWLLNLRDGPSKKYQVIDVLHEGDPVQIQGNDHDWDYVQLSSGITGWVVDYALRSSTTSTAPPSSSGATGVVTASALRVHNGPALTARVLTVITHDDRVSITGSVSGWLRIRLPTGLTGWVSSAYVRLSSTGENSTTTPTATATTPRPSSARQRATLPVAVRVHSWPALRAPVLTVARAGTRVTVLRRDLGTHANWTGVRLSHGVRGFVASQYVP